MEFVDQRKGNYDRDRSLHGVPPKIFGTELSCKHVEQIAMRPRREGLLYDWEMNRAEMPEIILDCMMLEF